MKDFRIITLGPSGAGKTVFLGSLFRQLSTQGLEGFFLEISDLKRIKQLNNIYTEIITGDKWPTGTRSLNQWTFDCCVKNADLEKYTICKFTYIDYAGGLLTDIDDTNEEDFFDFQKNVPEADAVLAILDGQKIKKIMTDQDLEDKESLVWLHRDLPGMMQLIHDCRKDTPVHFIISKWDLLEDQFNLLEVKERLLKLSPQLGDVVSRRKRAGCLLRLIPISSVGKGFIEPQADGSMKKNSSAIPRPFQIDTPLACALIDRLKTYSEVLKKESQAQISARAGSQFDFLEKLNGFYLSHVESKLKPLFPDKEAYLDQIKNEETAVNYLVGIFLDSLRKFEESFPESNLGVEIPKLFVADSNPKATDSGPKTTSIQPTIQVSHSHLISGHTKGVRQVGFTSDSNIIFSTSYDKSIRFWSLKTGKVEGLVNERAGYTVACLSGDNRLLFTSCEDKKIKVWDAYSGKKLSKPLSGHLGLVNSLITNGDGSKLISASRDQTIKIWNISNSICKISHTLIGHQGYVYDISTSADWQVLASGGSDRSIILWKISDGEIIHSINQHSGFVRALEFFEGGNLLVSGGKEGILYIWDWKSKKLVKQLESHTAPITCLKVSTDNKYLASGSEDSIIKLWDLSSGNLVETLAGHSGMINSLAFSPDQPLLASASEDQTIRIWRIS